MKQLFRQISLPLFAILGLFAGDLYAQVAIRPADTTACPNEEIVFSIPIERTVNADSLIWNFGDNGGKRELGNNKRYSYRTGGNYQISIIIVYSKDLNRKPDTLRTSITIYPEPVAAVNSTAEQICPGDQATLTGQEGFRNYRWEYEGEQYATGREISISQPGLYTMLYEDPVTGCTGSTRKQIFRIPMPQLQLSGQINPCKSSRIGYSVEPLPDIAYTWTVSAGGSIIAGNNSPFVQVLWNGQGQQTLSVKVTNTKTSCTDERSFSIMVGDQLPVSIQGDTVFCRGKSTTLRIAYPDFTILWSNGETGPELKVTRPGGYKATVIHPEDGCRGEDSVYVHEVETFRPRIRTGKQELLCRNDSVRLEPEEEYQSYLWSTGETTRGIIVRSPGRYIVTVKSIDGCLASDTLVISPRDLLFSAPRALAFGKRESASWSFPVYNAGSEKISLSLNETLQNPFSVSFDPPLPAELEPGDTVWVTAGFLPSEEKAYSDTLRLNITPCEWMQEIVLTGEGTGRRHLGTATIMVPDTAAIINQRVRIPVYVRLNGEFTPDDYALIVRIRFDRRVLHVFPSQNIIVQDPVSDSVQYLSINIPPVRLDNSFRRVTEFEALALMSPQKSSALTITGYNWPGRLVQTELLDGRLNVDDNCFPQLIRSTTPNDIELSPQPVSNRMSVGIASGEKGHFRLELVSAEGKSRLLSEWDSDPSDYRRLEIPSGEFPAGVYYLVLHTPWSIVTKPVLIVR